MLTDQIGRRLEAGGYRTVEAAGLPCRIMARQGDRVEAVCLVEDSSVFEGQYVRLDGLMEHIRLAMEVRTGKSCRVLALVFSTDIAGDRFLTQGTQAVWLIDPSGRRIVFDNQPGQFGEVETLLEKRAALPTGVFGGKNRYIPWATLALIAVNVIVQIIVSSQERLTGYSKLQNRMVLQIGMFWIHPEYYRLLTSAFLHFGWEHLFNNMLALLVLGGIAEKAAGRWRFLISYLLCGFGANLASVFWYRWNGELLVSTAGASGAVFSVSGMILIWVILGRGHLEQISLRQIALMMIFSIYNGIAQGGVNNCAHITGALLGVVCGTVIWMVKGLRAGAEKS